MKSSKTINKSNQNIVISLGDPAGIGMEITLKALASSRLPSKIQPIIVGCRKSLFETYSKLLANGISNIINPNNIQIKDVPIKDQIVAGSPTYNSGVASFLWLTNSAELVLKREAIALVTAPIAKSSWHAAGYKYPGQTERLAELTCSKSTSMLFTAKSPHNDWRLNTLLATTHIPIASVPESLTPELIKQKLEVLISFCKKFKNHPTIAVAGLNPHSGEKGLLGKEEITWLKPLLNSFQKSHPEILLHGPLPPDTCWLSTAKAWNDSSYVKAPDGILALYHDQGLIPVKLIAFDSAVNTTLGLPFIRTSPDHGTAFDIAGKGCASEESMIAAITTAWELSQK